MKRTLVRAAAAIGVEERARTAWQYAQPAVRRDLRDRANLRRLIAWTVTADGHCVDIGAHAGDVLTDLLAAAPAGRHLAFEPLPELAEGLRQRSPSVDVRATRRSPRASLPPAWSSTWRARSSRCCAAASRRSVVTG